MSKTARPTMLASELVAALQAAIAERGDLHVFLRDPDTDWPLPIIFHADGGKLVEDYPDCAPCMTITAEY